VICRPALGSVVVLGIAAATATLAPPAGADTNLGTVGDYTYMYDAVTIGSGVSLSMETACPQGTHLVSGGADDDRFDPSSNLQSSFPVDSDDPGKAPDDGWRMSSHNGLMSTANPEVFAVCQAAKPTYASKRASVAADSGRTVKVACPASTHVVSGGLRAKGPIPDVGLSALAPFDGPDANSAPGDGWRAKLANSGAGRHRLKLYAVCRDEKPAYKVSKTLPGNPGTHSLSAPCLNPIDAIVGGGLWLTGPATAAQLHESDPADDGDLDSAPSDDWRAEFGNPVTAVEQTLYVICA
jgi:hypothetical protein